MLTAALALQSELPQKGSLSQTHPCPRHSESQVPSTQVGVSVSAPGRGLCPGWRASSHGKMQLENAAGQGNDPHRSSPRAVCAPGVGWPQPHAAGAGCVCLSQPRPYSPHRPPPRNCSQALVRRVHLPSTPVREGRAGGWAGGYLLPPARASPSSPAAPQAGAAPRISSGD